MSDKRDFELEMAFRAYVNLEAARSMLKAFEDSYYKYAQKAALNGDGEKLSEMIAEENDKNG
jgi:hypothetical protein